MKRIYALILALCLSLSLVGCGQKVTAPTWQEQYDLGIRYLSEGNYEEAIIAFTAAIEIEPKQASAYVGRGDAYAGIDGTEANLTAAIADYEQAITLDGTVAEAYRKAAEIYVLLGDSDSAIDMVKRGVEATGDADLQAYLDELTRSMPLTVLTYQAAYRPDGTLVNCRNYYYDEQGYMIREEDTDVHGDETSDVDVETWTFDEASGMWLHVPERGDYDSDEEWENAKEYVYQNPGTVRCLASTYGGGYCVIATALLGADSRSSVIENGGFLYREETDVGDNRWDYAVYTFDDSGLPVGITTYKDGAITGTAILEWDVIIPDYS